LHGGIHGIHGIRDFPQCKHGGRSKDGSGRTPPNRSSHNVLTVWEARDGGFRTLTPWRLAVLFS